MLSTTGCFVQRFTVGDGPIGKTESSSKVFYKTKDRYLFWGGIALDKKSRAKTPTSNFQLTTRMTFVDMLVTGLTGGIYSTRTVRVYTK